MDKIKLVLQREYLTRVKNKTFILLTILVPLFFIGISILPAYLMEMDSDEIKIAVVDEYGVFEDAFPEREEYKIDYFSENVYDALKENFEDGSYGAIVHLPPKKNENHILTLEKSIELYSTKKLGIGLPRYIERSLENRIEDLKIAHFQLDKESLNKIETNVSLKKIVHNEGEQSEMESILGSALSVALGFIIYIFIFLYGAQIMRSVIEEKSSRIIEIIVSSVKPFQLLMGKILGVALVGLTQFAIWVVLFSLGYAVMLSMIDMDVETINQLPQAELDQNAMYEMVHVVSSVDVMGIITGVFLFLFYFLVGFLIYAGLFAAVGSAVEHESETQQFMLPLSTPLLFAMIVAQIGFTNPDSPLIYWLSFIPLTSPVIMMVRIPYGVPTWEILLSMALLVLGFIYITKFAAKIYKTGILMYGKKASFKEIIKWLRYNN